MTGMGNDISGYDFKNMGFEMKLQIFVCVCLLSWVLSVYKDSFYSAHQNIYFLAVQL